MLLLWYNIYLTYVPEKQAHNRLKNIVFEFFAVALYISMA